MNGDDTFSATPGPALAPVAPAERPEILDIVRGVAILGILFVNIEAMSFPEGFTRFNKEMFPGVANDAVRWIVRLLVEGKFYSLFSILFGVGIAIRLWRSLTYGRVQPLRVVAR